MRLDDDELRNRLSDLQTTAEATQYGCGEMLNMIELIGHNVAAIMAELQKPPSGSLERSLHRFSEAIESLAGRFTALDRKLDEVLAR